MTIPEQAVKAAANYIAIGIDKGSTPQAIAENALTAATPYMSGVKVRQLEWVDRHYKDGSINCRAKTAFGQYEVYYFKMSDRDVFGWDCIVLNIKDMEAASVEAAKAAAQADYEKRILSAIEPSSAREQALEEAVNLCSEYAQSFEKGLCHYGSADKDKWRLAQEAHISAGNKLATALRALKSQPVPQTGGGDADA